MATSALARATLDTTTKIYSEMVAAKSAQPIGVAMQQFAEKLKTLQPAAIRAKMRELLTIVDVDLSEATCDAVEDILKQELSTKQIVKWSSIAPINDSTVCAVWRGDTTLLEVDAITNAANEVMLGCFKPEHRCIDNVIHAQSGPRLRMECREMMNQQGSLEPTGLAKLTKGYALPAKHVIHTVGPICPDHVPRPRELASCYVSILELCKKHGLRTVAFCCISTGVFGYPNEPAARVALETVKNWLQKQDNEKLFDRIIFNTFLEVDDKIYRQLAPEIFATASQPATEAPSNSTA